MKVAISGPAGAGKGTTARKLAQVTGLGYVDLGLVFRLGVFAIVSGRVSSLPDVLELFKIGKVTYSWNQGTADVLWDSISVVPHLVDHAIAVQTSILAANPEHQQVLVALAEFVLGSFEEVVCDGRNAGTTILPNADHKFFITAELDERARRRHAEVIRTHPDILYERVLADIRDRDARDMGRKLNPLMIPEGAVIIKNDGLSIEESVEMMRNAIRAKR